MQINIFT